MNYTTHRIRPSWNLNAAVSVGPECGCRICWLVGFCGPDPTAKERAQNQAARQAEAEARAAKRAEPVACVPATLFDEPIPE